MDADRIHELTAPYVLDALGEAEEREYEDHLRRCPRCREELSALQEASTALAYAVDTPAPSPALRERILAQAQRERPNVVPLRPRWVLPAAASLAAAAASVALGVGIWTSSLSSDLEREREAREDLARATQILAQPGSDRVPISGAEGTLLVAPTGEAVLVVSGLHPAPEGKTYEAWVIVGKDPKPAGIFEAGDEHTVVALERAVPENAVVAVTLEPDGGVDRPTGASLFQAETA